LRAGCPRTTLSKAVEHVRVAVPTRGHERPASEISPRPLRRAHRYQRPHRHRPPPTNVGSSSFCARKTLPSMSVRANLISASRAETWCSIRMRRCANAWRWVSGRRASAMRGLPGGIGRRPIWAAKAKSHRLPKSGCEKTWRREVLKATVIRPTVLWRFRWQLGVADAIADVVGSGRTLALHIWCLRRPAVRFGSVLGSERRRIRTATMGRKRHAISWSRGFRGVVFGQQYLCSTTTGPRSVLDKATKITPGLESPTIGPARRPGLGCDPRAGAAAGCPTKSWTSSRPSAPKAILASDIRFCRF